MASLETTSHGHPARGRAARSREFGAVLLFDRGLARFEQTLLICAVAGVLLINVAIIVGRQLGYYELSRAVDIVRALVPWIALLGASLGLRQGRHVGLTQVVSRVPKTAQRLLNGLAAAAVLIFLLTLAWQGAEVVRSQYQSGLRTPAMNFPQWWASIGVPVGAALAATHHVIAMLTGKAPIRDEDQTVGSVS